MEPKATADGERGPGAAQLGRGRRGGGGGKGVGGLCQGRIGLLLVDQRMWVGFAKAE